MAVVQNTRRLAFGRFEVHLDSGELWKGSLRIRLAAQPFKLLSILLENPGNVVSRDELQMRLWGHDTNVDYERALAGAVNKIRDALGDSAEHPRYLETLPKRGYRFIAAVSEVGQPEPPGGEAPLPGKPGFLAEGAEAAGASATSGTAVRPEPAAAHVVVDRGRSWIVLAMSSGVAVLLIAAAVLLTMWWVHPAPAPEVEQITQDSPISAGPPNSENLPGIVSDGDRVLATALFNGTPQLASISTGTGDVQRVALPGELASVSIADLSRDGNRLLILSRSNSSASEQPLWIAPVSGQSAWRVGDVLAHDATWMPDGESILYAAGNSLTMFRLSDGSASPLATLPGRVFWPRWSPDGKLLRFTVIDPLTHWSELWELAAGGGAPHRLTGIEQRKAPVCCGVWSADGKTFVFVRSRERGSDLWAMRSGMFPGLERLTYGPVRYLSPTPARSGNRIYFLGVSAPLALQRFDLKRHAYMPVQPFLRNANRVAYSRNGAWVAWTDTDGVLWRARAGGTDKLQLTPAQLDVFSAQWSPDGKRLALMGRLPGRAWSIYLLNAAGGEAEDVLHDSRNAADPSWSPDGTRIAFGREPDRMGKETGKRAIYELELATGKVTTLSGSDGLFSPRWSPDGRWIAALTSDQQQVMLYDTATGRWQLLAVTSAADPAWSTDSQSLLVHAFSAERQPVLRIAVPGGAMQVLNSGPELPAARAEDYFFSGINPANEPLLLPRIGSSNLYTLELAH